MYYAINTVPFLLSLALSSSILGKNVIPFLLIFGIIYVAKFSFDGFILTSYWQRLFGNVQWMT